MGRLQRLVRAWPKPTEPQDAPTGPVAVFVRPTFGLEIEIINLIDDFDVILRRARVITLRQSPRPHAEFALFELLDHALRVGLYDDEELDTWRDALRVRCNILVPDRPTPTRVEITQGIRDLKHLIEEGNARLSRLEIIHGADGGQVIPLPRVIK